jgi:hypothetical protein
MILVEFWHALDCVNGEDCSDVKSGAGGRVGQRAAIGEFGPVPHPMIPASLDPTCRMQSGLLQNGSSCPRPVMSFEFHTCPRRANAAVPHPVASFGRVGCATAVGAGL